MEPFFLQRRSETVPLIMGMDAKTEKKAVQAPKLVNLQNASFFAPGEISKDRGYAALTVSTIGGAGIPFSPARRSIGCNGRQLMFAGANCYERFEAADRFAQLATDRGFWATASVESTGYNQDSTIGSPGERVDYAYVNGYELILSYQATALVYTIRRRDTKAILYCSATSTGMTAASRGAAFAVGNIIGTVWLDGINVRLLTWDTTTPTIAPGLHLAATDATGALIDAFPQSSTQVAFAYQQNATGKLSVIYYNVVTSSPVSQNTTVAAGINQSLTVTGGSAGKIFVAWGDSAVGLVGAGFDSSNTALGSGTIRVAVGAAPIYLTAADIAGTIWIAGLDAGGAVNHIRFSSSSYTVGTVSTSGVVLYGYDTFVHRAVAIGNSLVFGAGKHSSGPVTTEHYSTTIAFNPGATTHVVEPIVEHLYKLSALLQNPTGTFVNNTLSNTILDNGEYRFCLGERANQQSIGSGSSWSYTLIQSICSFRICDGQAVPYGRNGVAFGGAAGCPPPQLANAPTTPTPSGIQMTSFPFAPMLTEPGNHAGGSLVVGQTYEWVAVYEYIDDQGNQIQSSPSVPQSMLVTAGNGSAQIGVRVPFARHANRLITTVLYRTLGNSPGPFFRTTITTTQTADTAGSEFVNLIDGTADTAISAGATVYTDAGILENNPEPHGRCLVLHQDRWFKIDEHTGELRYTREILEGEGPGWHPNLAIDLVNNGISGAALVSTNNGLWIFGTDTVTGLGAIQFLVGSGPDDTGAGSSYALQRLEGVTVSCTDYRLCAATPRGVIFYDANQGWHLLEAQAAPRFIGAEIQGQVSASPIGLVVCADRKEVRIVCSNFQSAVWYYDVDQWALSQSFGAIDTCLWNGKHVVLGASSIVQQSPNAFLFAGADYFLFWKTGWIKTAQFKGLQRIWRIYLLGRVVTLGNTPGADIALRFDYDDGASPQDLTFSPSDIANAIINSSGEFELEIVPVQQVCEAFQVRVFDTASVSTGGAIAWTAIRIDFGVFERSSRTLPAAMKA